MSMTKSVKATVLSLGIGVSLAIAQAGQAQVNLVFVGGGSSALQGNYQFGTQNLSVNAFTGVQTTNASTYDSTTGLFTNSYGPGALPRAIGAIGTIAGYKDAVTPEHILLVRSFDPSGDGYYTPSGFKYYGPTNTATTVAYSPEDLVIQVAPGQYEVVNDAMIRTDAPAGGGTNVVILLRSDSGQGVRYVANRAKIVQFPNTHSFSSTDANQRYAVVSGSTTGIVTDAGDQAVINSLVSSASGAGINIDAGFSDVAADTVYRYARFGSAGGAGVPGTQPIANPPAAFNAQALAVQTLLLLHSATIGGNAVSNVINIAQHQAQNITGGFPGTLASTDNNPILWSNIDSRLAAVPVRSAVRENTSGTRMTYLVDILRTSLKAGDVITENVAGYAKDPAAAANPQLGTGTMVNAINNNPDAYGYGFITGNAGGGKPNVKVAAYQGVLPFALDTTGVPPTIPSGANYTTAGNAGATFYTEVANGRYPLWAVANAFTSTTPAGMADQSFLTTVIGAFGSNKSIPYSQGLTLVSDLNVKRANFKSSLTKEFVTDGMELNFDLSNAGTIPVSLVQ